MECPIQKGLAEFVAGCDFEKIPQKFIDDAKLRVLDWYGCALAGAHYRQMQIAGKYLEAQGGKEEATAIGVGRKLPARAAAFLNGIAGHVCELDDGHRTAIGHPGSITLPVALALGELHGASGKDFLKSVIVGYDMFARTGRTVNPTHYRTWHTTGTCGTIAAAATAASILKLTPEEANNALGLACTMAGGLVESFGSHAKAINIAEACQNGLDAAVMAKMGLTGSHSALLGKKGFVAATSADPHVENLENPSEATLVSDTAFFKVYASCGHTNSPLDCLYALMKEAPIDRSQIEKITVTTYKVSVDVAGAMKTESEDVAKFSIPYCFAISLKYGAVGLPQFADDVRNDPEILDIARRVEVTEDPEATKLFPRRVAEVTIFFKDGTKRSHKVWNSNDAADPGVIEAKFRNAASMIGKDGCDEVIAFVKNIEHQKDLGVLVKYLSRV